LIPVLAGCAGFFLMALSGLADTRGRRVARAAFAAGAFLAFGPAFVLLAATGPRLALQPAARAAALAVSALFAWLLLRALVLDLRPPRPSAASGAADREPPAPRVPPEAGPRFLSERGLYALCRHPGVPALCGFQASLAVATASRGLLVALAPWTACNLALAALEDRFTFPAVFGDAYRAYRARVPFLIPNAMRNIRRKP